MRASEKAENWQRANCFPCITAERPTYLNIEKMCNLDNLEGKDMRDWIFQNELLFKIFRS